MVCDLEQSHVMELWINNSFFEWRYLFLTENQINQWLDLADTYDFMQQSPETYSLWWSPFHC